LIGDIFVEEDHEIVMKKWPEDWMDVENNGNRI